jgi:hypothetical protein
MVRRQLAATDLDEIEEGFEDIGRRAQDLGFDVIRLPSGNPRSNQDFSSPSAVKDAGDPKSGDRMEEGDSGEHHAEANAG